MTGGSGGIGESHCRRLAAERHGGHGRVRRSSSRSRAGSQGHTATSGGASAIAIRPTSPTSQVSQLFDATEESFGAVDVVVNTAGIMVLSHHCRTSTWLTSTGCTESTSVAPSLSTGKRPVEFAREDPSSTSHPQWCKRAVPNYAAYAATKGAVDAITLVLAKELRGRDITVNAVAPGPTATPLFLDGKSQGEIDELTKMAPLERLGNARRHGRGRLVPWLGQDGGSTARLSTTMVD